MFLKLTLLIALIPRVSAADSVKTIRLCENAVATVLVSARGTVLDFPADPEKVVLGTKGSFAIEYIRNDLAISPATLSSRSNLFVYLQGRRFALDLTTSPSAATLYFIKDCPDEKVSEKKRGR
jgi:hypothetical protein